MHTIVFRGSNGCSVKVTQPSFVRIAVIWDYQNYLTLVASLHVGIDESCLHETYKIHLDNTGSPQELFLYVSETDRRGLV